MVDKHTIRQGQDILTVAALRGYSGIRALYDHPDNEALRATRSDPLCLMPGDIVMLPEKTPTIRSCETNLRHDFIVKTLLAWFTMVVKDSLENPLADIEYLLTLEGYESDPISGKTNNLGEIVEQIPMAARKGELTLYVDKQIEDSIITMEILIGHRDPVESVSGKQARLNALGFYCGYVDGRTAKYTIAAQNQFKDEALSMQAQDRAMEEKLQGLVNPSRR